MKRIMASLLLSLLTSSLAMAEPAPRPDDFSRMMPLTLSGTGPLHELALPAEVYRWTHQENLADIAVVNSSGEVVPFAIVTPPQPENEVSLSSLPLFPLNSPLHRPDGTLALQLRTDRHGAIVNLTTAPGSKEQSPVTTYIVDASGLDQAISGFDLTLAAASSGYLGSVQVEASDDLRQWRHHATMALATLTAGNRELIRQRVEFPLVKARYFRLVLGPTEGIPRLESAAARIERHVARGREKSDYIITPVKGKEGEFLAQSSGRMPVDRLRLVFPDDNNTAAVTFLSRPDDSAPWSCRGSATFYRMRRGTVVMESPPLAIPPTTDSRWLIRVHQPGAGLGARLPRLEVSWQPHRLIFAARGDAPFRLLYGSARELGSLQDSSIPASLEAWEQQQIRPLPAQAGVSAESGGREALRPKITAITWRKGLLWGTLCLGVVILTFMAWRLGREMSRADAPDGQSLKKDPVKNEPNP